MKMFSYGWFLENDRDTVERLNTVRDVKWYIDNFIEDNKETLNNMTLIGENVEEINWLYDFKNRVIPKYGTIQKYENGIEALKRILFLWFVGLDLDLDLDLG